MGAKLMDGWESTIYEGLLIFMYLLLPFVLLIQSNFGPVPIVFGNVELRSLLERRVTFRYLGEASLAVAIGVLCFVIELQWDTSWRLFNTIAHVAFGVSAYYIWQALPCFDKRSNSSGVQYFV